VKILEKHLTNIEYTDSMYLFRRKIMDYREIKEGSFKVIGIRKTTPYGGGTWGIVKSDGSLEKMQEINNGKPVELGLCFGFGEDGSNDYMVGIKYDGNNIPGYDVFEYPEKDWLIFEAKGKVSENILGETWTKIYEKYLPESKYKQADLPTIEVYKKWDEKNNDCEVEIRIPIEK
jgi:AraC family transcriptional regulator